MEYHVSKQGNDKNAGTAEAPFLTISRAAAIAEEGDRVIVHEGVYRECVRPANGSRTMAGRIIYEASPGEHAVIKGSESVDNWTNENGINKAVIPNEIFTDRNPYSTVLDGDWCWDMEPFQVTTETKKMVIENICFLLNNFIRCPAYENIIFSWVMQEQMIVDNIISRLNTENCSIIKLSLICTEKTLQERLEKDVADGVRESEVIARGLASLPPYSKVRSV